MDKLVVRGGCRLKGRVKMSGAKNAALPILAASLLAEGKSVIRGVPVLRDTKTMVKILRELGAGVKISRSGAISVDAGTLKRDTAPYELVSTMRASVCVLGPLVARLGRARVAHPGGCVIGPRPVDLHMKGLRGLGASVRIEHGYMVARGRRLKGATIYLGGPFGSTVLGTANVMMAACLAEGETLIESAACEPEIVDLAVFLRRMGADITGAGTHTVRVRGVRRLRGASHRVIGDRIETGTYMIGAAMTGGDVRISGACREHMSALVDCLEEAGVRVDCRDGEIRVRCEGGFDAVDVTTHPYPGFPTDLQAQMMAFATKARGISVITERIYPDRFMHVSELMRMGAQLIREGPRVVVKGGVRLSGAPVMASDLRASAALVLAGLVARGKTEISRIYHLDRGYEEMEAKLGSLGADIRRVSS